MGSINIGGQTSADHPAVTVFVVVFATNVILDPEAALTIAVPTGILTRFVMTLVNNIFLTVFTTLMGKWTPEGNGKGLLIYLNFGIWLVKNPFPATTVFFDVYVGYNTAEASVNSIPDVTMIGLIICGQLLPTVGLALLMKMTWTKEIGIYYSLGFIMSIYMKLPIITIVVIGIVIVVAIAVRDFEVNRVKQHPIVCVDTNDPNGELEDFLR